MDPSINEISVAVTGLLATGIMWAARAFMAYVNALPGWKKSLVIFGLSAVLPFVGKLVGMAIPNVATLMDPGVANTFAAGIVSMGGWALIKEVSKFAGKYNLSKGG